MAGKKINVSGSVLPFDFKSFAKNPIVGTLFVVLCGISALYVDVRSTFKDQIQGQIVKVDKLEHRVDMCSEALRRCDSALSSATTKLSTLEQLGKIQHIK